jgi:molybdate transport system regulatory protein
MWGRLKKIEQRMGKPLLIRQKGGASGGQSILTPDAKVMVDQFKQLQERLNDVSGKVFKEIYLE